MPESLPISPEAPLFLKGWKPYVFIVCLGALIYGQSLFFDFTYCDDVRDIIEKHELNHGFSQVPLAFKSSFGILYRPILRISWILDEFLGGTSPFVYHCTNLLYHLAASCLVMLALLKLDVTRRYAFFAGLVFVAHPLLAQAVVWIPGRNDSLLAIFMLLAMISLVRLQKTDRIGSYGLHFFLFALSLFTKETAAFFPLVGIYYLWVVCGERWASKKVCIGVAGWAVAGIGWLLARNAALAGAGQPHTDLTGFDAFVINLPALPALLGKLVVPWKLAGLATFEKLSVNTGFVVAALFILFCLIIKKMNYRRVGLGAIWAIVFLLPAMFHRLEHAADHYDYLEHRAYLPLFGVLLVMIEVVAVLEKKMKWRTACYAAAAILAVLAARGFVHSRTFSDRFVFWEQAVRNNPSRSNFHSVLGKLYYERGEYDKAKACFLNAIERSICKDPLNYKNLSVVYNKLGEPDLSLEMIRKAVEFDAKNADYRYSLGKAYYSRKSYDEAEACFLEAVRLDPSMADAHIHLVGIYAGRNEIDKAISACRKILQKDPNHFHALNILGDFYSRRNEWDEAAKVWIQIQKIRPDYLPVYENLMQYHLQNGREPDARSYALELLGRGGKVPAEIRARLNLP
ncbi:MAG: tetratricopeptide repeat protein [Planctomycetota bacterium]